MKAIDNQIRNISSSHQDKHSDKVNSHQHHGKVDKTHRAKIVEFDKLDNDSQIDNDFGLHIIYFLQHGHWKVNDRSHQMEKVWFYNSEPSIDIQEYNRWICPYISRHLLSLNPLLACCRRYSRGER